MPNFDLYFKPETEFIVENHSGGMIVYDCEVCGALVAATLLHIEWHMRQPNTP